MRVLMTAWHSETLLCSYVSLQFTDEHGEVCPANWSPGKKTLKKNKDSLIDYLANKET